MVQFGRKGEPDLSALDRILITDDKHRVRSKKAESITSDTYKKNDLPALARDGGNFTGNPHTNEQRRVNRGELSICVMHDIHQFCILGSTGDRLMNCSVQKPRRHGRGGTSMLMKSTKTLDVVVSIHSKRVGS